MWEREQNPDSDAVLPALDTEQHYPVHLILQIVLIHCSPSLGSFWKSQKILTALGKDIFIRLDYNLEAPSSQKSRT